ncbi:MAG: dTMP kinase [Candidatus Nanohaloarchaea archaeon]|nr:dTMP kinase [Candidatus Nanohaloarchaea archaeon]
MPGDGLFIVIEGTDASGKETQAQRLVDRLRDAGHDVQYAEHPAYDTEFGELVAQYLPGEYGDKDDIPVELRALLYSLDRYQFKHKYQDFLESGGILISNRYSQSNFAYQSAEAHPEEQDRLVDWMKAVDSRLPQPDHVFFLNLPITIAREFMEEKGEREYLDGENKDIHEKDVDFQQQVAQRYLDLAEQEHWTVIDCHDDGRVRKIGEIEEELYGHVEKLLQKRNMAD